MPFLLVLAACRRRVFRACIEIRERNRIDGDHRGSGHLIAEHEGFLRSWMVAKARNVDPDRRRRLGRCGGGRVLCDLRSERRFRGAWRSTGGTMLNGRAVSGATRCRATKQSCASAAENGVGGVIGLVLQSLLVRRPALKGA